MAAAMVQVGIGEVSLGRNQEVLSVLLGSCVGIGMLWPQGRCCALAHCLLPTAPEAGIRTGARYVNCAVPLLLAMMGVRTCDRHQVQVVLVGGARMLGMAGISSDIGQQNVAAAHSALAAVGLAPRHVDTGGRRGRTLRIDCARGTFEVCRITPEPEHAGT